MPEWVTKLLANIGNVLIMLLILVIVGALIVGIPRFFGPVPTGEIQTGLVVVFALVSLLVLLTVMAAVFSHLKLADSQEALGLPKGSVRALIALFLILIFIIMSVYLFRSVSGREGSPLENLTIEDVTQLQGQIQILDIYQNNDGTFDVIPQLGANAASEQLALQLVTLLGTLVTAVSAFYFGSASAKPTSETSTIQRVASETPPDLVALSVDSITPPNAPATAGAVNAELTGTGFIAGAQVKLRLTGEADVSATNVTIVDATKITCTLNLSDKQTSSQWDVVVINPDGRQVTKSGIFQITDSTGH